MALALVGGILSGVLAARGRLLTQWHRAEQRQEALQATDLMLGSWWESPDQINVPDRGTMPGSKLDWQLELLDVELTEPLQARVVRLSVNTHSAWAERANDNRPLVQIDLVLPDPEAAEEQDQEEAPLDTTDEISAGAWNQKEDSDV